MVNLKRIAVATLFFCAALACNDEYYSPIPSNPVNISLDLNFRDKALKAVLSNAVFTAQRDAADRL